MIRWEKWLCIWVVKKGDINDNSSTKITALHNYLLMIIFDTPKKVYLKKK